MPETFMKIETPSNDQTDKYEVTKQWTIDGTTYRKRRFTLEFEEVQTRNPNDKNDYLNEYSDFKAKNAPEQLIEAEK